MTAEEMDRQNHESLMELAQMRFEVSARTRGRLLQPERDGAGGMASMNR